MENKYKKESGKRIFGLFGASATLLILIPFEDPLSLRKSSLVIFTIQDDYVNPIFQT